MPRKQIPFYASSLRCFKIGGLVAYQNAATDVHRKALHEILDHPWCRLASRTYSTISLYRCLGMVRAVLECIYVRTDLGQVIFHPLMQRFYVSFLVKTSSYSRLVSNHEHKISSTIGKFDRFARSLNPFQPTNLENIAVVLIEHSISIKENRWSFHFIA